MKYLLGYFQFNVGEETYSYKLSLFRRQDEYGNGFQIGDNVWRTPIPFYEFFSDEYTWSKVNHYYDCDS